MKYTFFLACVLSTTVVAAVENPTPPKAPEVETPHEPKSNAPSVAEEKKEEKATENKESAHAEHAKPTEEIKEPEYAPSVKRNRHDKHKADGNQDSTMGAPGLGAEAFCEEIKQISSGTLSKRASILVERKFLESEKEKVRKMLEALKAERIALKTEREKLEATLGQAKTARQKQETEAAEQKEKTAASNAESEREKGPSREQLLTLAKTVKAMKPGQAASLVARLEKPLAVALLKNMSTAAAAAVLAQLKPEMAATLVAELSQLKDSQKATK